MAKLARHYNLSEKLAMLAQEVADEAREVVERKVRKLGVDGLTVLEEVVHNLQRELKRAKKDQG